MTKKDYQAIANEIQALRKAGKLEEGFVVVRACDVEDALARVFKRDNDRFSPERFFKACGRE